MHAGRFVVSWPQGGDMEITAVQGHMVNPALAPAAARFLLDVADGHRCELRAFDWGPATAFPFLPRIQRGRIVLSLARWRIDPGPGGLPLGSADGFSGALSAWRQRWGVPRHVYLTAGDNRLLLDLDHPGHHELLRSELRSASHGHVAVLQEALPGPQHAWLPGADGSHVAEVIVPLMARAAPGGTPPAANVSRPPATPPARPQAGHQYSGGARIRLPGSDWLYLKVFVPPPFQDDLIAGPVRGFAEFAVNAQLADGWHFLRYRDPDPHLRIRFHGEPASLLGPLLTEACNWAADLVADGTSAGFGIEAYDREVERYGGEDGMRAAEAIFNADSKAVAEILRVSQDADLPFDITTLAVLTVADLLAGLDLGTAEDRAEAVGRHLRPSRRAGQEYRERKRDLRLLLGDPASLRRTRAGKEISAALAIRRSELAGPAGQLRSLERGGLLSPPRAHIGRSVLHLHVNRLLGMDREDEQLVLQLLRYTWQGLSAFPVGRDHDRDA